MAQRWPGSAPRGRWVAALLGLILGSLLLLAGGEAGRAYGQITGVELKITPEFVGLQGYVRPGEWTPMRLTLTNRSAQVREVRCRWLLSDQDGDTVVAERTVTVNPFVPGYPPSRVWLYGSPPRSLRAGTRWIVQLLDAQSGEVLATEQVAVPAERLLPAGSAAIGICGTRELGLGPFTRRYTQHEPLQLITGLRLEELPDRWHGLRMLQTLIWTAPEGGDPLDPAFRPEVEYALRQWVRSGGHLVIVLPAGDQAWTGSRLADLLPVQADRMRGFEDRPPDLLGMQPPGLGPVSMTAFDVDAGRDRLDIIARSGSGGLSDPPVAVAGRSGFGRVTLIGVDLAHSSLARYGFPGGVFNLWHDVFFWQGPAFTDEFVQAELSRGRMSRPEQRQAVALDGILAGRIGMTGTAAGAVLAALVVFGFYWLVAGPGLYAWLRRRQLQRHAWVLFLGVVSVFTLLAWGGAWLLKPAGRTLAHVSVLDLDLSSGRMRASSWASIFLPAFGRSEIALPAGSGDTQALLASPGLDERPLTEGFLDPQPYTVLAADPRRMEVPARATTKMLQMHWLAEASAREHLPEAGWPMPESQLRLEGGWPAGTLTHQLPGALENVLVVFAPGRDGTRNRRYQVWTWRVDESWKPGKPLVFSPPSSALPLVIRPVAQAGRLLYDADRIWAEEGLLGQLIGSGSGGSLLSGAGGLTLPAGSFEMAAAVEMLSFYGALPPPNFRLFDLSRIGQELRRPVARHLDFSALLGGRRLFVLGHLPGAAMPIPLSVEGRPVTRMDPKSWVVVRMMHDF